jgi:hypothetical protein
MYLEVCADPKLQPYPNEVIMYHSIGFSSLGSEPTRDQNVWSSESSSGLAANIIPESLQFKGTANICTMNKD